MGINKKICCTCHIIKPINEFHKCKTEPSGYHKSCKICRSQWAKVWNQHPRHIYRKLLDRKLPICSKEDFLKWYSKQKRKCVYCGIDEKYIKILPARFHSGFVKKNRLQIDRKNSFKGYTLDNIALSCPICNYTKHQFLNPKDMKIVGKIIYKKWKGFIKESEEINEYNNTSCKE